MWEQFHHQMSQKLFHSTERTVRNNNLDPNSWCTLYSWAPSPNRYHRPYLHVLGCWEKQIDWVNSHITTQWEREGCHVQQTKEYTSDGSASERMSALSSAESHTSCVCVCMCVHEHSTTTAKTVTKIPDDFWTQSNVVSADWPDLCWANQSLVWECGTINVPIVYEISYGNTSEHDTGTSEVSVSEWHTSKSSRTEVKTRNKSWYLGQIHQVSNPEN